MKQESIYFSYSMNDSDTVRKIFNRIKRNDILKRRYKFYNFTDISLGTRLSDSIETALRKSEIIIFFISKAALDSKYFLFELGAATSSKKKIILVDFEHNELPIDISKYMLIRGNRNNIDKIINDIFTYLEKY